MIKATTDAEVRAHVEALGAGDIARREAAIARLIILGRRAVRRLVATYDATDDRLMRIAILRVLGASGDDRGLGPARDAVRQGGEVAVAGIGLLGELLQRSNSAAQARAFELLLAVSADGTLDRRVRAAAAAALAAGPPEIARALASALPPSPAPETVLWEEAAEGRLPEDPAAMKEAIAANAAEAPLTVLHRMIEAAGARERDAPAAAPDRTAWREVRGALHEAVAARGSRVGLYDLRETFSAAPDPLPASFVAAVRLVGDATCLEPLAIACEGALRTHPAWAAQLAEAFRAVAKREHLTPRRAAMRRAISRCGTLDQR